MGRSGKNSVKLRGGLSYDIINLMLAMIGILAILTYMVFLLPNKSQKKQKKEDSSKLDQSTQMKKLWSIAQESMKTQKPIRAEKALLAILNFDERNAAAYNRLGILYTKEQRLAEATECFEIAQSLDRNPALFHNTGLIYLETGQYEKAVMAFRQALEMEGDMPARFIALAKAEEKLGKLDEALEALESAFELNQEISTLRQILAIHEMTKNEEAIAATNARIEEQIAINSEARKKKLSAVSKRFSEFKRNLKNQNGSANADNKHNRPSAKPAMVSPRKIFTIGARIKKHSVSEGKKLAEIENIQGIEKRGALLTQKKPLERNRVRKIQ